MNSVPHALLPSRSTARAWAHVGGAALLLSLLLAATSWTGAAAAGRNARSSLLRSVAGRRSALAALEQTHGAGSSSSSMHATTGAHEHGVRGQAAHAHLGTDGNVEDDIPTPHWHERFTIDFNESTKIFRTAHMNGRWYYDANNSREAIFRDNGQGDRYCGSVHPFSQTPCTHLVVEGQRYLIFPDLGDCCMCCTAEKGCGILSPHWLDEASFEGVVLAPGSGYPAFKWRRDGLQPNYYYATADDMQLPLELDQMPNDLQTLKPETFRSGPISDAVFALPADCKSSCPFYSVCSIAALLPPRHGGKAV